MPGSLSQFYNDLKNKPTTFSTTPIGTTMTDTSTPAPVVNPKPINTMPDNYDDHRLAGHDLFYHKATHKCHQLMDKCGRRILIDIYYKILPLDDDWKCKNMGTVCNDVDCMLKNKNMSPTQYLTSCYEKTKAPLLQFIRSSIDEIGNNYMKETEDEIKDAQETDIDLKEPKDLTPEDKDIDNQIVDVTQDMQYDDFVSQLKKKTIDKIVADITEIINNQKDEDNMTFDTGNVDKKSDSSSSNDNDNSDTSTIDNTPDTDEDNIDQNTNESVASTGFNWVQKKLWYDNIVLTESQVEDLIGFAIRESALHELDLVFAQTRTSKDIKDRICCGKGNIINESTIAYFKNNN